MAQMMLALEVAAFWPVWIWWVRRIGGDTDAAWGLVASATAFLFAWRRARRVLICLGSCCRWSPYTESRSGSPRPSSGLQLRWRRLGLRWRGRRA